MCKLNNYITGKDKRSKPVRGKAIGGNKSCKSILGCGGIWVILTDVVKICYYVFTINLHTYRISCMNFYEYFCESYLLIIYLRNMLIIWKIRLFYKWGFKSPLIPNPKTIGHQLDMGCKVLTLLYLPLHPSFCPYIFYPSCTLLSPPFA